MRRALARAAFLLTASALVVLLFAPRRDDPDLSPQISEVPGVMRRALARAAFVLTASALVVLLFAPRGRSGERAIVLPAPPQGATIPRAEPLPALKHASRWASVQAPVLARQAPSPSSRVIARVSTRTPEGTTNILELLGTARLGRTGLWQRVRLAALPNGMTGWVPQSALGASTELDTELVVDLAHFRATLFRDGAIVFRAPVGVGQRSSPTPTGTFYIRDVLTRYRSHTYGPVAFGTSARSAVLTDWPAGGYIGIHGTDQPRLVPGAISHGCMRMRNSDITLLAKLMPVGTPVVIR
ncbi:MAG: L,D-transpeptidase family protein [Actinomycetota bacterium]|nr:L,D-transpeptidase family protein [Actinomycetota bacterium]